MNIAHLEVPKDSWLTSTFKSLTSMFRQSAIQELGPSIIENSRNLTALIRASTVNHEQQQLANSLLSLMKALGRVVAEELIEKETNSSRQALSRLESEIEKSIIAQALKVQGGLPRDTIWYEEEAMLQMGHEKIITNLSQLVVKKGGIESILQNLNKYIEENGITTIYGVDLEGITLASTIWNLLKPIKPDLQLGISLSLEAEYFNGEVAILPRKYLVHGRDNSGERELVFGFDNSLHSREQMKQPFSAPILVTAWEQDLDSVELSFSELVGEPEVILPGGPWRSRKVISLEEYLKN